MSLPELQDHRAHLIKCMQAMIRYIDQNADTRNASARVILLEQLAFFSALQGAVAHYSEWIDEVVSAHERPDDVVDLVERSFALGSLVMKRHMAEAIGEQSGVPA